MHVEILDGKADITADDTSFVVKGGISLEGAAWKSGLALAHDISQPLPPTKFTWKRKGESGPKTNKLAVPVYLNETRAEFLFSVDVESTGEVTPITWCQRGVAMTVWRPPLA